MTTTAENFHAYAAMREMEDLELMALYLQNKGQEPVLQMFKAYIRLESIDAYAVVCATSEEEALQKVEAKYEGIKIVWPNGRKAEAVGDLTTVYLD